MVLVIPEWSYGLAAGDGGAIGAIVEVPQFGQSVPSWCPSVLNIGKSPRSAEKFPDQFFDRDLLVKQELAMTGAMR